MSQSFDFASNYTHTQLNGSDCSAIYLNGTRIWERYTAQRQVWVSSGYNSTSNVHRGTYGGYFDLGIYWMYTPSTNQNYIYWKSTAASRPTYLASSTNTSVGSATSYNWGNYTLYRSSYRSQSKRGTNKFHLFTVYERVTNWVDTSSYQTENYNAYYY